MLKAAVAGHICVDLIPELKRGETIVPGALVEVGPLAIRPGGCVANTGCGLHTLGHSVRLVADIGDDDLGTDLLRVLSQSGLDCTAIRRVSGVGTSYSLVFESPGSDRCFWHHVGANAFFDGARVDLDDADLVHIGYPPLLPAMYASGGAALSSMLRRVRQAKATTSLDLSTVAPGSPAARIDWGALLASALPLVDVLSPSVDDIISTLKVPRPTSGNETAALARRLVDMGAAAVLLTDGERGMHLVTAGTERFRDAGRCFRERVDWSDKELFVPAGAIRRVETTGAGDAATAGLLSGVLAGNSPEGAASQASQLAALRVGGESQLS